MTFSSLPQRITSRCIDHIILKKRWRDIEKNDRQEEVDRNDDYDIKLSPWTVCQFEFDEDYLSNHRIFRDLNSAVNILNLSRENEDKVEP